MSYKCKCGYRTFYKSSMESHVKNKSCSYVRNSISRRNESSFDTVDILSTVLIADIISDCFDNSSSSSDFGGFGGGDFGGGGSSGDW